MTVRTPGISTARVLRVSLSELVEICRPSRLKPAVFKVLPRRVIKLTVPLWAMFVSCLDLERVKPGTRAEQGLLTSTVNPGTDCQQMARVS